MQFIFAQNLSMSKNVSVVLLGFIFSLSANAQVASSESWQPDFNRDELLSMPDLLPLLGHFGSAWNAQPEANDSRQALDIAVLDWTGQEGQALILRSSADVVVLRAGVNDGSDPQQRSTGIRHVLVESWLPPTESSDALEVYEQMPMKSQVLLLDAGRDQHGNPMPFGTRYILHFPDGSKGEVSTNSMGSMSVSGKSLRTMAQLLHAGGQVFFLP
jgi:hypothetical protein